jgi:ComF family protein
MKTLRLNELKQGLMHLFYPRLCEGCSRPLVGREDILCISCALALPETGYHHITGNETELRFAGRIPYIYATTFAYFTADGLLQHLLHRLKYSGKQEIGYYLGKCFGQRLLDAGRVTDVDIIIPVPLHKAKHAQRGYNQSLLIAQGMSEVMGIPAADDVLVRVKNTNSQTKKTRTERVNNMSDAFEVKNKGALTGKHVLLCDDVLTTGATLEACALALLKEESLKISIATIGIAVT